MKISQLVLLSELINGRTEVENYHFSVSTLNGIDFSNVLITQNGFSTKTKLLTSNPISKLLKLLNEILITGKGIILDDNTDSEDSRIIIEEEDVELLRKLILEITTDMEQ